MATHSKRSRVRSSPTGFTPKQPSKKPATRLRSSTPKMLTYSSHPWTISEDSLLVEYLLKKGYSEAWPKSHPPCVELWDGAVCYLAERGHKTKRTSK